MKVLIRGINFTYLQDSETIDAVVVMYDGMGEKGTINGSVRLTNAEYEANKDMVALRTLTLAKIKDMVTIIE